VAEAQPQTEAAVPLADNGVYAIIRPNERLYQGALVENVVEWTIGYEEANHNAPYAALAVRHPLAIIMSQDCDLEGDFRQRQTNEWAESDLPSILLCPGFAAEKLRLDLGSQKINSARWNTIRTNKDDRYAYLAEVSQTSDSAGKGHPSILLDLTSCFTVRTSELYRQVRLGQAKPRCRLETPWREHLQLRFANYLARIGLPRDHFVPESKRLGLPAPAVPPAV
jgi:hypothetical protein